MSREPDELGKKIREWLAAEGYPLEFKTAREFLAHGFDTRQGSHVRASATAPREVDVLASATDTESRLRVGNVIECKWSGDKPWVIFTSETHRMAPSACVNQTFGSLLGRSIAWVLAGDPTVKGFGLFRCPDRGGFGGRQAFSKGNDLFYATVQSVVSKANALVSEYDDDQDAEEELAELPEWAAVAFPVIVVEGDLFEGHMDWTSGEITVEPAKHLRIHWTGSEEWDLHASLDVVSHDYVGDFAAARALETKILLEKMKRARINIEECWSADSLDRLDFQRAPRGTTGLPAVLRAILKRQHRNEAQRPRLPKAGGESPSSADHGQ